MVPERKPGLTTMQTKTYFTPIAVTALLACSGVGCVSIAHVTVPTGAPTVLEGVPGDRDDVPRALLIALEAAQAALLEGQWTGDRYEATFLVVENRQGQATATLSANPGEDGAWTLSAFVEPAGDQDTQDTLLKAWARRLDQLHGVQWAPR